MADLRIPDLNTVTIAGRLTRDPELRYTSGGTAYCKCGLAATRRFKGKDGNRAEETTFVDFTLWGQAAEWFAERHAKGRPVLLEGALKTESWEKDGKQYSKLTINASRVQPLDWDGDGGGGKPVNEDDIPF